MSKQKNSLFKKIDGFIFSKVSPYLQSDFYKKFEHFSDSLNESSQKLLNNSISTIFVFLPLLVTFILMVMNINLRSENKHLKETVNKVTLYGKKNDNSKSIINKLPKHSNVKSKKSFQYVLNGISKRHGIPDKNFIVQTLSQGKSAGSIKVFNANIIYKSIGIKDLSKIITELFKKNYGTITKIGIKKNSKNLMDGNFSIQIKTK